jgi:hypothetical protein
VVGPVVGTSTFQPAQPEIQNPENYYTCRYDYVPQGVLDELLGRTADSSFPRSRLRLARRRPSPRDDGDWPDVPDSVPDLELPPRAPSDDARKADIRDAALSWVNAVDLWQRGNREFKQQRYANAITAYTASQQAVTDYFAKFYSFPTIFGHIAASTLIARLVGGQSTRSKFWELINRRRVSLSLRELQSLDWGGFSFETESLIRKNLDTTSIIPEDDAAEATTRQQSLDYFGLLLTTIFIPLARAEANRLRGFYAAAAQDLQVVLAPYDIFFGSDVFVQRADISLTCDFIERPFARRSLGETLLNRAEIEYKSESLAEPDAPQEVFDRYHGMKAAETYLKILDLFADEGNYVTRVASGRDALANAINDQITHGNPADSALNILGKEVTVAGISSTTNELPGLARTKAPGGSWLKIADTVDGEAVAETNPFVYVLLLTTQARLEQLAHEFNYLGYRDDYVPPWRFQFLLERARYFAGHARMPNETI